MSEETIIRTAVVTGGSRGIGRAVCIQLAKQGCNVVVNYCHGEAAAAETVALCKAENANAVAVQADVSTAEGCKTLFEQAVNAFGRVDILVNNAGITRDNLILRMSEEDFDAVLNANLKGAFLCCKEAARRMVRQRWGRIVNLSSVVALRGNAGQTNYAASKAGLIGLTKSLARELASRNVTVNAVAPGDWAQLVLTPFFASEGLGSRAKGPGKLETGMASGHLPVKVGEYANVAIVFNGKTKKVTLFVDGKTADRHSPMTKLDAFQSLMIGRLKASSAQQMQIDEIRVYNTPLSAEWIDEIEPLEGK